MLGRPSVGLPWPEDFLSVFFVQKTLSWGFYGLKALYGSSMARRPVVGLLWPEDLLCKIYGQKSFCSSMPIELLQVFYGQKSSVVLLCLETLVWVFYDQQTLSKSSAAVRLSVGLLCPNRSTTKRITIRHVRS